MSFLLFLFAISLLVVIHELGHYLAARIFGVKAEEFGFGFPPRVFGFVRERGRWQRVPAQDRTEHRNTVWSLNWLPLGGFVRIKGEREDGINDPDSIHQKPIWQRVTIIAAGVVMNWMLAALLFTFIFAKGTIAFLDELPTGARVSNRSILITQVLKGSPASKAGIKIGDELMSVDGFSLASAKDVHDTILRAGARQIDILLKRNGERISLSVTSEILPELQRPGIGIGFQDTGVVSFTLPRAAYEGVRMTAQLTKEITVTLGTILRDLILARRVPTDVSGPVGIAIVADRMAKQGIMPFLQFAALLSVNLAVINFLPIPALDGGRCLFLVLEKLRRRPLSRTLEIGIHNVAFVILILIIILVTVRDVSRFFASPV